MQKWLEERSHGGMLRLRPTNHMMENENFIFKQLFKF